MSTGRFHLVLAPVLFLSLSFAQEEEKEEGAEEVKPPKPVATVDIANSKQGGLPGGTTPRRGKWMVDAETDTLRIGTEPLVEGWLEFGPEIREKPATIKGSGRAPGSARIQSRFGIGLYGPNGFQLRLVPATDQIEMVRRKEVIEAMPFELDVETVYEMELAVVEDERFWRLKARVWKEGEERPEEPQLVVRFFSGELLFPLAGRAVLTATPFSGESVEFSKAEVYEGEYIPVVEAEEEPPSEPGTSE